MNFRFGGILVGANFEAAVSQQLLKSSIASLDTVPSVHFDLRDVRFMDCYCAQLLICYVRSLDRRGALVTIKLPERKPVRDMLRVWSFDEALREAVGSRLSRYCDEDDRSHYFPPHETQTTFDLQLFPTNYALTNEPPDPSRGDQAGRTSFYGFRTIRVPADADAKPTLALAEKLLWQSPQVARYLERDFSLDVRFFSARIIFEAVFNALRHPNADIVQTATHTRHNYELSQTRLPLDGEFAASPTKRPSKSAVIHYWDDGTSILDIINKNLANGTGRRTQPAGNYATSYRLKWKSWGEEQPSVDRILTTSDDATGDSHVSEKLVFVLQPYVSMEPTMYGHASTAETKQDEPRLASIGMGLFLLLDTAIRMFGGSVRIRTANVHLDITRGYKTYRSRAGKVPGANYVVYVREMSPALPKFPGNLITISLPEQRMKEKLG
ncbi:hypothetical protein [Mesorhizobium sp.]|uniref:hypothetical protein n=1 Tax=Mesorhizobium sp. TaxID=1871066 RepID=UPI001225904E|nr:hypothetical protein [Mesorhizobium sp.]TIV60722.1 MAG: hypothetical protein E5V80_07960 [Mesorhizobium sp.]